ncbi:hypothetical protein KEM48_008851 [Puccinia striiformis f. sp. tritici PST-130]|nr:hypothetical protein KEM48_008851 [Puccinia striiformis f. sp. tritici PST-130]
MQINPLRRPHGPSEANFRDRNPLDGVKAHTEASNYMFQYFLKVVGTQFQLLDGQVAKSHQYSVTQYERDLDHSEKGDADELGHLTSHGHSGVPGVFFNYEISPMQVVHREYRQSFAHFATSTCAIVGGVLTVAGLLDSFFMELRIELKLEILIMSLLIRGLERPAT